MNGHNTARFSRELLVISLPRPGCEASAAGVFVLSLFLSFSVSLSPCCAHSDLKRNLVYESEVELLHIEFSILQ